MSEPSQEDEAIRKDLAERFANPAATREAALQNLLRTKDKPRRAAEPDDGEFGSDNSPEDVDRYRCGRCGAPRHRIWAGAGEHVPGCCARGCDDLEVRMGWRESPSLAYPKPVDLTRWRDA